MGKHSLEVRQYEQAHNRGGMLTAEEFMPETEATAKVSRFARMLNRIRGGEKIESSTDTSRRSRGLARAAMGLITTVGVALNIAPSAAEAPAPRPETTVVAYGAGMTNPPESGKVLPVSETRPELRGLDTDKVVIAGYPGRIFNAPISLGDTGIGSLVGPGGFEGSTAELKANAKELLAETGAEESYSESLGTAGMLDAMVETANENPGKRYKAKVVVSPYAPNALADDLDQYFPGAKPVLDAVGLGFSNSRNEIPETLDVEFVDAEGDLWSEGPIANEGRPNAGKFDLKATIEGTFGGHYRFDKPTGSETHTVISESGTPVEVTTLHYDRNRAGNTVAAMANSALAAINGAVPENFKQYIPDTVGNEVFVPDVIIDPVDPLNLVPDAPASTEPTITYPEIQGEVVPPAAAAPAYEAPVAVAPVAAPIAAPSFEALQEQVQNDFDQAIANFDNFAAQNGFQLPPIPGITR